MKSKSGNVKTGEEVEALAARWGCSARTIHRWNADGAPFGDEEAMKSWLTSKQKIPVKTKALLEKSGGEFSEFGDASGDPGAAAALRRLEQAERGAYEDYRKAIKSGQTHAVKYAQERWLKVSESLRRYDLLVEQSRRDSGELVSRAEVERIMQALAWYLRVAGQQVAVAITKPIAAMDKLHEINHAIDRGLWEQLLSAFAALASNSHGEMNVPTWITEALCSDLDHVLDGATENMKARAAWLEKLCRESAKAAKKTKGKK